MLETVWESRWLPDLLKEKVNYTNKMLDWRLDNRI